MRDACKIEQHQRGGWVEKTTFNSNMMKMGGSGRNLNSNDEVLVEEGCAVRIEQQRRRVG